MDRQGCDPLAKTITEVAEFMKPIEMSEDFDGDRKVAAAKKKGNNNNKKKSCNKGSSDVARQQQHPQHFGVQVTHGAI